MSDNALRDLEKTVMETNKQTRLLAEQLELTKEEVNQLKSALDRNSKKTGKLEEISADLQQSIQEHQKEIRDIKRILSELAKTLERNNEINRVELMKIETEVRLIHKDLEILVNIPSKLNEHILEMQAVKATDATIKRIGWVMVTAIITMALANTLPLG